jgi:hypothetical protein
MLSEMTSSILAGSRIIREPVGGGAGYWCGAPGAFYEPGERTWYLTYRIRRPRGIQPDRGGEARIARSKDLESWEDIWSITKDKLGSSSIERTALHKGPDGRWRYFISYVDPADDRWCLSMISAREISLLNPSACRPIFKAKDLKLEGVKDPWIFKANEKFHMLLSVAVPTAKTNAQSHSTRDIFNTGECVSATALASSTDLENWDWGGIVFSPGAGGWDKYCRRINSLVQTFDGYYGFYDGSASHAENYEERTAIATSADLQTWNSLSPDGPALASPHASGSLRYVDAQILGDQANLFYEFARSDGSHDLRLAQLPRSELEAWLKQPSKATR